MYVSKKDHENRNPTGKKNVFHHENIAYQKDAIPD